MLRPADLPWRRQQVLEVTPPAGRIFTNVVTARHCPIENGFDAATQHASSLWLYAPQRFQDLCDQRRVDSRGVGAVNVELI